MSPAQRIALISSSYHPYPGGVEEHTRNVARVLAARGVPVEVWTVDRGERLGVRSVDGVTVRYLPTPLPTMSPGGVWRFLAAFPGAARSWWSAYRRFRPDVLHVHCFGPNGVYADWLARATRTPLALSAHGETFMDEDDVFTHSRLLRSALVRGLRDADAVTGCSGAVIDDLTTRFGLAHGTVVPNGVDLSEAATLRGDVDGDGCRTPTVFAVGRMVPVKGFDLLLRAFAAADLPRGTRLVLGGDGPERRRLEALAAELGIDEVVEFPGRLDRAGVVAGMASADVVVVPSRIEAFGIVVLEAWRSGAALLCTNRGGPASFVRDGVDGLLVDPLDTPAVARALGRLLTDPRLRAGLSRAGLASVSAYTWEEVVDRYQAIYAAVSADASR